MATTLLSDSLPAAGAAPQLDVPETIEPVIETSANDIGLRSQSSATAIKHPLLSDIVRRDDKSHAEKAAAILRFEDDMTAKIADAAGKDSKSKNGAIRKLDADIAIANAELLIDYQRRAMMDAFPTIAERDAFAAASAKGGGNPDAYDDPKHRQFVADLNETSGQLFGGLNRSWTGDAATEGGYKVAGFTVKPMSNGEAVVNLRMQGQEPVEALAVPSPVPVIIKRPDLDKGWDSFSKSIRIKLPTQGDVDAEIGRTDKRLDELKAELPAARRRVEQLAEGGDGYDEGASATAAVLLGNTVANLEAESRQLQQRRDVLVKDGKRTLANELVADTIRNTPELAGQIRDKGVGERLRNATESLVMSFNVAGEELGIPWQQGAREAAAEAASIIGELGRGMERAEFRGTMADRIGVATVETIPLLALQAGASGAGLAASLGPLAVSSYGSNLVSAEQQAQAAEDRGDMGAARKIRDNARSYSAMMTAAEIGTEMMFPAAGAPLSKASRGMRLLDRFATAPFKEGVEEVFAGGVQARLAPMIDSYESPFSSDRLVEFGAGFLGSQFQQISGALLNTGRGPSEREQIEAMMDAVKRLQSENGVNVHDDTPIDIKAMSLPVVDESGRQSSAPNPHAMFQPEGSQNWTIADPALRQRAVEAGVKTEFPTEQEAGRFAQTMHQTIAEAELRAAAARAGIPQDQVDSSIVLIRSALKQAAIAEGQRTDNLWARYQFQFMPGMTRGEETPHPAPGTETQAEPPEQQAPAPVIPAKEEAGAEADVASRESSPPAPTTEASPSVPVGDSSIPAVVENANAAVVAAGNAKAVRLNSDDGRQVIVARDPEDNNSWRATLFDGGEPVNHELFGNRDNAIRWVFGDERTQDSAWSVENKKAESKPTPPLETKPPEASPSEGGGESSIPAVAENATTDNQPKSQEAPVEPARPITSAEAGATPAPATIETKLQEGREAVNKKQAAPEPSKPAPSITPGAKLKARIEGQVQDVEYIKDNGNGSHQVMTEGGPVAVRTSNLRENSGGKLFQSLAPSQDADYMAAVERGDMAEAQRMVDEAAKAAGYDVGPVFHHGGFDASVEAIPRVGEEGMHFGTEQAATERAYGKQVDDFIREGKIVKGSIDTPLGPLHHALISLTNTSDVSTIMHEFIHGLALLETPIAGGKTQSLLQSILGNKAKGFYEWASQGTEKLSPEDAHVRMHERIAEGFEKWLTDGSLPEYKNQGLLRKAFEAIKSAMRGIVRDMLGRGFNYQHIDPSKSLPANVQDAYEQLFAILDDGPARQREIIALSALGQIGSNSEEALDALYPLTRAAGMKREAFTEDELAEISALTGDSIEELSRLAGESVAKSGRAMLFQSLGEGLPADKAKPLIDAGTAALVNAMAKNAGKAPAYEEWIGDIKSTGNPAFAGLGEPAMKAIYYASTLNIPAAQALTVQQKIDAAVIAAGEVVTPESKAVFNDAINSVMPTMQPAMAKRLKVAAQAVQDADTAKKQSRAMNAAMKIVRANARSKFSIASKRLYDLLKGYRFGTGNANQVRDIIDEVNKVIKPLLKSGEIGRNTKKLVEDTMTLMGHSARGDVDMQDVVRLMQHNIGLVQSDLAKHAEKNFLRGAAAGGKHAGAQFKARQQAIIGVILDELKTVTGLSPEQTERAIKYIGKATTDKQLNKAAWKALLLFQEQRVRDAYEHVSQLQAAIKDNIKKGKFGDLNDWVGKFNAFEPHTIPQHMLAQYSYLAEMLSSKNPVIPLNGMKNQLESMNRQMDQWLEANPEEEQTRPPHVNNSFAEALERLEMLNDLDSAKRARQRARFVTEQQGFGKTKEMAEEAAKAISQMRVFETFEEADEIELSHLSNRQLRGVVIAFENYNAGMVTPFIVQKAQDMKARRFQELFLPQLTYGARHFLRLSADARLDAPDADLRAASIMGRIIGWAGGYRSLADRKQAKGAKAWFTGSIEGQFREAGLRNFDSMLNTAQWINENIVTPIERSQVTGLLERDRVLTMKDESGKSIKDYELDLDDPSHYRDPLLRAMTPELDMGMWSSAGVAALPRGVAERVSNIKNARRELLSRIMGMAMHQRQREQNGMEGNYIDYMLEGALRRNETEFSENEFKRQQAAARVIKTMLGEKKPSYANISAFLPEAAKRSMALADRIFDTTGQWTYYLNMVENEPILPMPLAYFPIMSMEENTTIEQRIKNLTGIPLGAIGGPAARVAPRAGARHARLNENLKMANADFFGVVSDAVHQAAADSAMTPFLKVVNKGFNSIQMMKTEHGTPMFGGLANSVVVNLHKALIEHGARMSHVILADPGVATKVGSYLASIFPRMVLDKAQRPLVEGVGNLATILLYGNASQFADGLGAVWGPSGDGNEEWGRLMLRLKAPTALRNGSESTTGPMQDMAAALASAFDADPHLPTWTENLIAEVNNKTPQRRGFLQRSQSHALARLASAIRHLMVTAGEQLWLRPYWAGHFMESIKRQTGSGFSMQAYKEGAYTEQQLNNAVSAAETEVARIMSPSARGSNRLSSQAPLDSDENSALFKRMVYAMTNFIGSQSNTAKFAMKALIEGRAGNIDKRGTAARMLAGLVVGNMVNNAASSFFVTAMRAWIDMFRLGDEDEKKSLAIQQYNEWLSNANPLNVKSAGAFWGKTAIRSAFTLRFGGLNTLARFMVGTATELLWWGGGEAVGGFKSGYDPFKDNLTYEAEPGITAAIGYKIGISDDPQLWRAFQNTNAFTSARLMGSVNALAQLGGSMMDDYEGVKRMMAGEGDGAGAAANLAVNAGLLLSSIPFYATLAESTSQIAKLEAPRHRVYQDNALSRIARTAGRQYAATGDVKFKDKYEAMPAEYKKEAIDEITRFKYFERASAVAGNPRAADLLADSLNSIRHAPEAERAARMAGQFREMEKAGLKKEFLRGLRLLRSSEAKFGTQFGARGSSSDFANDLKAREKAAYGRPSLWLELYDQ